MVFNLISIVEDYRRRFVSKVKICYKIVSIKILVLHSIKELLIHTIQDFEVYYHDEYNLIN